MTRKIQKDSQMLARMVQIYCRDRHKERDKSDFETRGLLSGLKLPTLALCRECTRLLTHGLAHRITCPFEFKPACKHCPAPCYTGQYRAFVKLVMRYSGLKLIRTGRLDLLWRYLF